MSPDKDLKPNQIKSNQTKLEPKTIKTKESLIEFNCRLDDRSLVTSILDRNKIN